MHLLPNPFKKALSEGKTQIGLWLSCRSAYMAEVAATARYDWLLVDGEHAPNTIAEIHSQLQAIAPYQSHPIVRPLESDKALVKQLLDIGAQTLLLPMIDSAHDAEKMVAAIHYPPLGTRGVGADAARASRWGRVADYMAQAQDNLCLILQIESKAAVDSLDDILQVEGVDALFIGPSDLSASLGYPGNPGHPEVQKVIEACIKKIRSAGKAAGTIAIQPAMAQRYLSWGANFIAVGVDILLYNQALDNNLALFTGN
ncbi:MAG: aldolase/citrate lyase family protein [Enterobacteriaceae bacterium]